MFIPWWGILLAVIVIGYIIFAIQMRSADDHHNIGTAITTIVGAVLTIIIILVAIAYWLGTKVGT